MRKIAAIIVATTAILIPASTVHASDGDLDTSWGGTGVVISSHADPSTAYAIATYPGDRVLAVGSLTDGPSSRILINRFLANGVLDPDCEVNGEFLDTGRDAVAGDVVVLVDGSFVITGTMQIDNKATLFLAKFTSACRFENSFGDDGIATYSASGGTSGRALVVQPDGKIVVVGDEYPSGSDNSDQRILVTRFTASGDVDDEFGSGGSFISSENEKGQAQDVVIGSAGQIIFAGSIIGTTAPDAAIVGRLTSNGQLDPDFAAQGYFIDELGGDPQLNSIALRANGNLVAVGSYIDSTAESTKSILVVCLNSAGGFDTECAPSGWGYFADNAVDATANSVVITEDGFIILGGTVFPISGDPANPYVMRLDHTANLDLSFADHGVWAGSTLIARIHSVSIQNDGRIIAAGTIEDQGIASLGVIRLTNTVTVTTSTTTSTSTSTTTSTTAAPLVTTTAIVAAATTIVANQLPATGRDENGLLFAVAVFGIGILLMGMRRRALR